MIVNTTAKFISASPEERKVVANAGGGTLYYYSTEAVSSTEKSGELASTETTTINHGVWVVSASQTAVEVSATAAANRPPLTIDIREFGADVNRADNASAINAAIAALPATGGTIFFPVGVFTVKSVIEVKKESVRFMGQGWDQSTVTSGSVLKAGAVMAALVKVTSEGTTFRLDTMSLSGGGNAESVLKIEALNCQIREAQIRQPKTAGICVDVTGESVWLTNLRVNAANAVESTGIQLNGTDATVTGCKPVNCRDGIVLKSSSSGAIISGCHMTPGSTIGRFCIYAPEQTNNITITGNRIDNHKLGAGIMLVFSANTLGWNITNNVWFQNVIENETWPAIGLDVTSGNSYGITIVGNTVRSASSHLYSAFVAAIKIGGETASNPGRVKSGGAVIASNSSYSKAFYGTSTETLIGGSQNSFSSDGTTWEAK